MRKQAACRRATSENRRFSDVPTGAASRRRWLQNPSAPVGAGAGRAGVETERNEVERRRIIRAEGPHLQARRAQRQGTGSETTSGSGAPLAHASGVTGEGGGGRRGRLRRKAMGPEAPMPGRCRGEPPPGADGSSGSPPGHGRGECRVVPAGRDDRGAETPSAPVGSRCGRAGVEADAKRSGAEDGSSGPKARTFRPEGPRGVRI